MSATTYAPEAAQASKFDLVALVSRILLVAIFPISGWFKLMVNGPAGTASYFEKLGAPMPEVAVWVAIIAEFVLPVLVVLGIKTRWAAIGLLLYVLGTTIIGHRFWEVPQAAYFGQLMSFWKNVAMMGGLALLAAVGPGRYAVDPRP
jgi:putative oxidoreductase